MRLTDDRYATERSQFELALRMIRHEARTRTIRECTGLSDDRIRKLYATYFRNTGATDIRRRRGKSPRQVTRFVKNPQNQLTYLLLHGEPQLSFEWAWNLLHSISYNDELYLAGCRTCRTLYVQDAYAIDNETCPCCAIEASKQRS